MRFKYIIPMDFFPEDLSHQRWEYITTDILPGVYDYYMISDHGLIWNRRERRLMSITPCSSGYLGVHLSGEFGSKTVLVHRLVALAFVYNPDPLTKIEVNHKDGNKHNNYYTNLEWATPKENIEHAINTGLMDKQACAKTTEEERQTVIELLKLKKYSCKEISNMTGISKSIISHIRYNESWNESIDSYNTRNTLTEIDIRNLCKYFHINKGRSYSTDYMREALSMCNLGTDANWVKMCANIFFRKTYKNISDSYDY